MYVLFFLEKLVIKWFLDGVLYFRKVMSICVVFLIYWRFGFIDNGLDKVFWMEGRLSLIYV